MLDISLCVSNNGTAERPILFSPDVSCYFCGIRLLLFPLLTSRSVLDISLCVSDNGFSATFLVFLDVWFSSSSFVFSSMIYIMFLYFYFPLFAVLFFFFLFMEAMMTGLRVLVNIFVISCFYCVVCLYYFTLSEIYVKYFRLLI